MANVVTTSRSADSQLRSLLGVVVGCAASANETSAIASRTATVSISGIESGGLLIGAPETSTSGSPVAVLSESHCDLVLATSDGSMPTNMHRMLVRRIRVYPELRAHLGRLSNLSTIVAKTGTS